MCVALDSLVLDFFALEEETVFLARRHLFALSLRLGLVSILRSLCNSHSMPLNMRIRTTLKDACVLARALHEFVTGQHETRVSSCTCEVRGLNGMSLFHLGIFMVRTSSSAKVIMFLR